MKTLNIFQIYHRNHFLCVDLEFYQLGFQMEIYILCRVFIGLYESQSVFDANKHLHTLIASFFFH